MPETREDALGLAEAAGGSLQDQLDHYSHFVCKLSPEMAQAYDALVKRLATLRGVGPGVGEVMPDFALISSTGELVDLQSLLREGPIVVSFNRGHWCRWCRLELRALAERHEEIRARGAQTIAIVPETGAFSRKLTEENRLPFPVLTDLDLGYSLSLGIVFWAGPAVNELYKEMGIDLAHFQNSESWMLPIPATFVVGSDGVIKARFVEPDFRKRMDPAEIIAALDR